MTLRIEKMLTKEEGGENGWNGWDVKKMGWKLEKR